MDTVHVYRLQSTPKLFACPKAAQKATCKVIDFRQEQKVSSLFIGNPHSARSRDNLLKNLPESFIVLYALCAQKKSRK
jgi:hypothetical protein